MQQSPTVIIILALFTLLVLIAGIVIMAKGGKFNKKHSNKLMIARVALQGLTLLALGAFYFIF